MGFAPAFVIHDWLYVSRGQKSSNDWKSYDTEESALILAEGIKTLMESDNGIPRNPGSLCIMYSAARSPGAEYAARVPPWFADLPSPDQVASMGAQFYDAPKSNEAPQSVLIKKEKFDPKIMLESIQSIHQRRVQSNKNDTHTP